MAKFVPQTSNSAAQDLAGFLNQLEWVATHPECKAGAKSVLEAVVRAGRGDKRALADRSGVKSF